MTARLPDLIIGCGLIPTLGDPFQAKEYFLDSTATGYALPLARPSQANNYGRRIRSGFLAALGGPRSHE